MEKEFKIELPELNINQEQIEKEIKAKFKDDFEKGGILTQAFIFAYLNQPASVTEIMEEMVKYYKREFDRTAVFRALDRLTKLNIVYTITSGDIIHLPHNEMKDVYNIILTKFNRFLDGIPVPFRKRYTDVNYFWIANGDGLKYIKWCCNLLNFKCDD